MLCQGGGSSGSGGAIAELGIQEKGVTKGSATKLDFKTASVSVVDSVASIAETPTPTAAVSSGPPLGTVLAQDWRELVHTDETGKWLMLNGRAIDLSVYYGAAECSGAVVLPTIVPRMTADATGVWTAKAGSVLSGSPAYLAFEGDDASFGNGWHSAAGSVNASTGVAAASAWVQITKTTPFRVYGYYILGYTAAANNTIASWRVLASDDQVNFVTIDEHLDFHYGLEESLRMNFSAYTSKEYKTYRLQILKTNIGTGGDPATANRTSVLRFGLCGDKASLVDFGRGMLNWPYYVKAAHVGGGGGSF